MNHQYVIKLTSTSYLSGFDHPNGHRSAIHCTFIENAMRFDSELDAMRTLDSVGGAWKWRDSSIEVVG